MFKNIDQLKAAYGGIQRTMNFDTWLPFIDEAREKFFVDVLGDELLEHLDSLITTNGFENAATDEEKRVIKLLRTSLAAYADYVGSFRLMQTVGDAGKTVASPPNMQAPGKWLSVASRNDAISRGDEMLERALKYMEKHLDAFTVWSDSDAYTVKEGILLANADDFTAFFPNCKGSRRMYLKMVPYLKNAQAELKGVLTKGVLEEILEKYALMIAGTGISEQYETVIELCRKMMANKAVEKALPYVNINEDWRLVSETDGIVNENVLTAQDKNVIVGQLTAAYESAKAGLVDYIYKNASEDLFADYYASDDYATLVDKEGPTKRYVNKKENKFAIL